MSSTESNNNNKKPVKPLRTRQRATRARHRLRSIYRDACALGNFHHRQEATAPYSILASWPVVANERCGSWYIMRKSRPPEEQEVKSTSCYFKSTDGHTGNWFVSLKRLNLSLLEKCQPHGGCRIVDSSTRKILPDSFARTIPLWACVLNRIALKYRHDLGMEDDALDDQNDNDNNSWWDTNLYTPSLVVPPEEHSHILEHVIDERVEALYQSRAIVDPRLFVQQLVKRPLRPIWISNHDGKEIVEGRELLEDSQLREKYFVIVCHNPSIYTSIQPTKGPQFQWKDGKHPHEESSKHDGYYYTPGAADDQESWARGLSASLFWDHFETLFDPDCSDDEVDQKIDAIVKASLDDDDTFLASAQNHDRIGRMNLWIGSRRASRPPDCWHSFDAILNVTNTEYSNIMEPLDDDATNTPSSSNCRYYLQLPVAEGKRDKTELERWLPVGLTFLFVQLQRNRRVLVHCAQGKDRSVAIVLAFVMLTCQGRTFPLQPEPPLECWGIEDLYNALWSGAEDLEQDYLHSDIPEAVAKALLDSDGHEIFLKWAHAQLGQTKIYEPLANKESLRVVFHLVRQDREVAEPTRATFQKLNRFFMSSPLYRQVVSRTNDD